MNLITSMLSEDELVVYYSNVGVNVIDLKEQDLREMYRFIGDMDALAIRYSDRFHLIVYDYCNNSRFTRAAEKHEAYERREYERRPH